ncbi:MULTISPECIES: FUSC family protein [unclassified Marinobacter]|uniref:FUSC family protein n=1 Tax=unclassified Marinobacter TaxID=83889 RepID=UPI0026E28085|nr:MULTISPECIES: FUSC family protein [unclassified Marinobacter]MDO6442721.1 FUSC family protein [Marinobacter sp. 2_MG-2023]MDO6823063.1 FUSC family protein [Marinobacter sp. 1_MG-2023]
MTLHPLLAQLLMPDRSSVIFALKGVVSVVLALYVAMFLQLDRPYWALVSAIFLQIRPESGLVTEKAACQILGSVLGGGVGILILAFFMPYPLLALACLTLWIGLNSAASSMVHNINFIYAFAMSGMTAGLVVLLVMITPNLADSRAVFDIAQSRISEITVGALCAMLVSQLLWPVTVKASLRRHARVVINDTLEYLSLELDPNSTHEQRHQHADQILETLVVLNDDSSAVAYEGPEGPGRSRAANLLCNKVLSLLAVTQIMGRFPRNHPDLVSPAFSKLLEDMRAHFIKVAEVDSFEESYIEAQALRRALLEHRAAYVNESAIVIRLTQTAAELVADLAMVLRAYNALENRDQTLLKASSLKTHRDPLVGAVNGFRTAVVFLIGAAVWLSTGSLAAIMLMIMPVVFSVMFARFSRVVLTSILRRLLLGVVVAIPVALLFGMGLLSTSSGDFELLALVLAGPYFVALLALANRETLPYGLGLCIPFTLIVQPGNHMTFNMEVATSNALGLFVGISILYWVFKLITPPDGQLMQRRLLEATARDLTGIDFHRRPENWFNGRMGERLLRLANYDQSSGSSNRNMTDLGFTGLNIGHMSIRLRRRIKNHRSAEVDAKLAEWQQVLADTYLLSSRGIVNARFREASAGLLRAIYDAKEPDAQTATIEGMFERMALTFERTARMFHQV